MLFNSTIFVLFFVVVFIIYWFLLGGKLKEQNVFLLIASYIFYGCWDYRFLLIILLSTITDYFIGNLIYQREDLRAKARLLTISLFVNLGALFVFKYFNFFSESFAAFFLRFGLEVDALTLNLVLPVGISFYTFQTLSYTIDIYKGKLKPTRDFVAFAAFVSFFPQLVAGPIEKAKDLLPQFLKDRKFNPKLAVKGLEQSLWGLFKKVVIADNCAPIVNQIFSSYDTQPSSVLILGLVLFAFQIYGDFSGYSDMAIGTAKLLGFNLSINFKYPFFSTSMSDMWRRWHISLSTWTGEYIFMPLSAWKKHWKRKGVVFALMATFLILGIWHGANWTFVAFGLLHGTIVSVEYVFKKQTNLLGQFLGSKRLMSASGWFITMSLWLVGMCFFRSIDIASANAYLHNIFVGPYFDGIPIYFRTYKFLFAFLFILFACEWYNRKAEFGLDLSKFKSKPVRWGVYYALIFVMLRYSGQQQDFIYFQF